MEFNVNGTEKFHINQYGGITLGDGSWYYSDAGSANAPKTSLAAQGGLRMNTGDTSALSFMFYLESRRADSYGQMHKYIQRSSTPAASDTVWSVDIHSNPARTSYMATSGKMMHICVSPGSTSNASGNDSGSRTTNYQSEWRFYVCNNANEAGEFDNAVSAGTFFSINYSGQGVDASAANQKEFADNYEDRWGSICERVKDLRLAPWRTASDTGPDDRPWFFGASAEDFYETFELGEEPRTITNQDGIDEYKAGIRPGDPAFLALAAVQELHARVKALEDA